MHIASLPLPLKTQRSAFSSSFRGQHKIDVGLMLHAFRNYHLLSVRYYSTSQFNLNSSLDSLLQKCCTLRQTKEIHAQLITGSPHSSRSSFLYARVISLYSRLNSLSIAQSVFDAIPCSARASSLLHNSIIRANLLQGKPLKVVSLYLNMLKDSSFPDGFTFPLAIKACSQLNIESLCLLMHAHVVVMDFRTHVHVCNELLLMYANMGQIDYARKVFDRMTVRNVITWNMLISGYSSNFDFEGAIHAFRQMKEVGPKPDAVTWTSVMSAHARCRKYEEVQILFHEMRSSGVIGTPEGIAVVLSICSYLENDSLCMGKKVHDYAFKLGFDKYLFVGNSLIYMYGKLGFHNEAEVIFSEMDDRTLVSWNALISIYAASGLYKEAYDIFTKLENSTDFKPNVVSWSAIIGAFSLAQMPESALEMFRRMQNSHVVNNSITIATILSSCAELSSLDIGKEIHGYIIKNLLDRDILVCNNGLLNMYTKSGNLKDSISVFRNMNVKDSISWNTIISGFGMHGFCDEAFDTFDNMIASGVKPDGVTFVALLSACSHAGRVSTGHKIFHQMSNEHNIAPSMEHFSCIVDLLGRAGLIKEAYDIVKEMPFKPNACVIGALLNACRIHGNSVIAEDCITKMLMLDEEDTTGNYMLLSNLYAASGDYREAAKVRIMTKAKGLKKECGQSWVEVAKKVYVFSAGSSLPVGAEVAYGVIEDLSEVMESENYVAEDCVNALDFLEVQ